MRIHSQQNDIVSNSEHLVAAPFSLVEKSAFVYPCWLSHLTELVSPAGEVYGVLPL